MAKPTHQNPNDLTRSRLNEIKRKRLQYTVKYAYDHSPFYRDMMDKHGVKPDDIRGIHDLELLPVVTSADIRGNQRPNTDEFRFRNPDANTRRPYQTSGTSGAPKTVFLSYDEQQRVYEGVQRGMTQLGVTAEDTVVNYFPFVGLNISCHGNEGGLAAIGCETIPISNTPYPPDDEFELLTHHQPDVLIGLPSHIDRKGQQFKEVGHMPADLGVRLIVVAGEPVSESRKSHLGEVFNADVYEFLGATEAGGFAWECSADGLLHVIDTLTHVEAVDQDGGQKPTGEEGRLVLTNLLQPGEESAMPLIRYALGDLVTAYDDEGGDCNCALRGGMKIEPPTRHGNQFSLGAVTLSPQFFEAQIYGHPELRRIVEEWQVLVEYDEETAQDVATLRLQISNGKLAGEQLRNITPTPTPSDGVETLGTQLLDSNQHLRDTVNTVGAARINIEVVDEIEMPPGKPQRLVDHRDR